MTFRPATIDDEARFLYWRLRAEREGKEAGYWHGRATTKESHHEWYIARLRVATMLVWEWRGEPLGILRIDSNGELTFHAEPDDAVRMLKAAKPYARDFDGRLKVTIDAGNSEATIILNKAGFSASPVRFFYYRP